MQPFLVGHYQDKRFPLLLTVIASITALHSPAYAGWFYSDSPEQASPSTLDVETVKEILMSNPSIVNDAQIKYQKEKEAERKKTAHTYLKTNARKLFYCKTDGVLGNPTGKTSVLFLNDYRDSNCNKARTVLDQVIAENDDVRVVVKQLPVLGPDSMYAAKAAIFAQQKNKFESFDTKMKAQSKPITAEKVNIALTQVKLKPEELATQLDNIQLIINKNYMHAQNLNIESTPVILAASSNLQKVDFVSSKDVKTISDKIKEYQS